MESAGPAALVAWAEQQGIEPSDLLAGLVLARAEHLGASGPERLALVAGADPPAPDELPVAAEHVSPDLLGEVLGAASAASRRHQGVVFTPRPSAEGLVRVALDAFGGVPHRVLDPAVGGGAFVLAVVRALVDRGMSADEAFACVQAHDTDPLSVQVAAAALGLWYAEQHGVVHPDASTSQVADFLLPDAAGPEAPVDLVVGNPPFLSQLRRSTTRSAERLAALRSRYGTAVGPYTDDASLFLLAGLDRLHPGGVMALIQPRSFLGAGGAQEVRRRVLDGAALVGMWEPVGRVFPVAVDVCAPVFVRSGQQPPDVRVWHEVDLGESAGLRPSAELLGDEPADGIASSHHDGPPMVALPPQGGRLAEHATVTAGFRDQFYGMAPCIREADGPADPRPRLITSGLIDPGVDRWGRRPARIARQQWTAPVLEVGLLDPDERVGRWVAARLVPKVVVASQTKVVEATLDLEGRAIPSPPTVSVEAPASDLPRLLAVLLAPTTTAWLHRRAAGTGLAPDALRVSRAHLAELPLPGDRVVWDEAAALLLDRCGGPDGRPLGDDEPTRRFGELMGAAYGLPASTVDLVLAWWLARLPAASLA
jgi:hypothetical protein